MIPEVFQTLDIALGLGLLVGLQRERSHSRWAGIRTFPLITLLGTICGLLAAHLGGWIVAAVSSRSAASWSWPMSPSFRTRA